MDNSAKNQRKFHTKKNLLALYLSIGIIGICMLVFSAWTPLSAHKDTSADPVHNNIAEHNPENNSKTPSSDDNDITQNDISPSESLIPLSPVPLTSTPSPTPTLSPTPTATPTPTSTPTPTPNPLRTNAYDEVNTLIESYYDAKLSGEADDFEPLVSDLSTIDIDYLHIQYGLITDFNNFTCYTKNGIADIAYVVYVAYDSKIVTIDTPVPALDRLTLVYADDGSGRLLVNTASEHSDEVNAYLDEIAAHNDVKEMYQRETKRFEDALNSDPELGQLYNRLEPEGAN